MNGYFGFIHPPDTEGGSWGVTFPDLPGCTSGGDTLEEAARNAREALSGHLSAMRADGDDIPRPRAWTELSRDPEAVAEMDGSFIHYIESRGITGERVRVNVMVDKGLLRVADEAADAAGMTRSGYIEAALLAYA